MGQAKYFKCLVRQTITAYLPNGVARFGQIIFEHADGPHKCLMAMIDRESANVLSALASPVKAQITIEHETWRPEKDIAEGDIVIAPDGAWATVGKGGMCAPIVIATCKCRDDLEVAKFADDRRPGRSKR